jgi:hypothetical protein
MILLLSAQTATSTYYVQFSSSFLLFFSAFPLFLFPFFIIVHVIASFRFILLLPILFSQKQTAAFLGWAPKEVGSYHGPIGIVVGLLAFLLNILAAVKLSIDQKVEKAAQQTDSSSSSAVPDREKIA